MTNENENELMLQDIQNTQKMCQLLLQSPHYKKMGPEGVYAIVEKAKSMSLNPLEALNGGMYFVRGKVELTSSMMNHLIRKDGHSITKDKRSDDTVCILHGRRKDNGDTWVESFSIEDAKKAGIYANQWMRYPKDMLFARALSRLARQLFPDVIKGCYVEGEIKDAPPLNAVDYAVCESDDPELITDDQWAALDAAIGENALLRQNMLSFVQKKWGIDDLKKMPVELYEYAMTRANSTEEE